MRTKVTNAELSDMVKTVHKQAEKELADEEFRKAVEDHKTYLRTKKPFYHKIFPWKITVTRRDYV